MKDAAPSVAGLYQRKFLVVGEPLRRTPNATSRSTRSAVTPLVTPTLDDDPEPSKPLLPARRRRAVQLGPALRRQGAAARTARRPADLGPPGTRTFPPSSPSTTRAASTRCPPTGRTSPSPRSRRAATPWSRPSSSTSTATPELVKSEPQLMQAKVELPASSSCRRSAPSRSSTATSTSRTGSAPEERGRGLGRAAHAAEAHVRPGLPRPGATRPGASSSRTSRSPGCPASRGPSATSPRSAKGTSGPTEFLGNALPKLFGLVSLVDLLETVGVDLDDAPDVVSEALDRIEGFLADLERAKKAAQDAVDEAKLLVHASAVEGRRAPATGPAGRPGRAAARDHASRTRSTTSAALAGTAREDRGGDRRPRSPTRCRRCATRSSTWSGRAAAAAAHPQPAASLAEVLRQLADAADLIQDVFRFVNGLATGERPGAFRYEWRPKLKLGPLGAIPLEIRARAEKDSLVLAVDGRVPARARCGSRSWPS